MGVDAGVRDWCEQTLAPAQGPAAVKPDAARPQIVDYTPLLYRSYGDQPTYGDLYGVLRGIVSQHFAAHAPHATTLIVCTDVVAYLPPEKAEERARRRSGNPSRTYQLAEEPDVDTSLPSPWRHARQDDTVRIHAVRWLRDKLVSEWKGRLRDGCSLLVHFSPRVRVLSGSSEEIALLEDVPKLGEGDLMLAYWCNQVSRFQEQPVRNILVRTNDSDALPILLAAQARVAGATITLWLTKTTPRADLDLGHAVSTGEDARVYDMQAMLRSLGRLRRSPAEFALVVALQGCDFFKHKPLMGVGSKAVMDAFLQNSSPLTPDTLEACISRVMQRLRRLKFRANLPNRWTDVIRRQAQYWLEIP